jgi:hypothetical protein
MRSSCNLGAFLLNTKVVWHKNRIVNLPDYIVGVPFKNQPFAQ